MTARSIGYARCSTASQKTDAQVAALKEAGCAVVFEETVSTRVKEKDRPQLQAALNALVEGDELVVAKWICTGKRLPTMGRPAMAATARKEVITRRMTLLESLGLKLSGLQSDTIALTNFVDHEFSGMWPSIEGLKDENIDSIQSELSESVCLIDAGASTTHLILVSAEAHWSWSIETGGDDITLQLASSAKVNRADAEKIKFAPNQLPRVAEQYLPIESSLDTLRSRISTMYNDAMKQENPFRPSSSWCVGGACQTYQWIRRIMVGK